MKILILKLCIAFLWLNACTNPQTTESEGEGKTPPTITPKQPPHVGETLPTLTETNRRDETRPEVGGDKAHATPTHDRDHVPSLASGSLETKGKPSSADRDPIVCSFPEVLKKAISTKINKNCSSITLKELSEIKHLDISHTNISNLGPEISSLKNLITLDISNTKIQNLGPEMCQLQKLTTLKASHNTYEGNEMPISLVCLSELKNLDLSYSSLQYIDEYIFYLKKLENLNLRGNHLMNLPAMLALLPSLVTLDLRGNWFEYKSINSLHDCSHFEKTSDDRKECQEEMLEDVQCEYWYEIPEDCSHLEGYDKETIEQKEKCEKAKFKRGVLGNQSFIKRYEEMTGEKHVEKHEKDEGHLKARCYYYYINQYVFYNNPDDPKTDPEREFLNLKFYYHPNKHRIISETLAKKNQYLLDLTINGKTIRELRLMMDEISKNSGRFLSSGRYFACQLHMKGVSVRNTIEVIKEDLSFKTARKAIPAMFKILYHGWMDFWASLYHFFIWPQDTTYGPSHHETHAERHRVPEWNERPEKSKTELCNPIDYSVPIPSGPLGPWSNALPAVQALIEEKYLEPGWNECENWPTGQCYDWEERIERGENPGGFKKEYFAKKINQEKLEKEKATATAKLNETLKESNNGKPH